MRLRRLSLERFGRFDGCDLDFRAGNPDLHVVYGSNEAGKTTSMAAVSELLFGFEMRSRYNFRFDYPMLRIGAVVEEDDRVLSVRRRKTNAGSLVDADDRPIDEGAFVAMLHGATRESFRAGFSLDNLRLREGGRAIVQAKDDVGQALFAAGSGLTGVVSALAGLEKEADAIWGRRRSEKRSYTQAQDQHDASRTAARDMQVRPKAWSDARERLAEAEGARNSIERHRDGLVAEQRRVERVRRLGPLLSRRAELMAALLLDADVVTMPSAREERVVTALEVMAKAERDRAAADALHAEAVGRLETLAVDRVMLAASERIDALIERRGAEIKAADDAARLTIERRLKEAKAAELRRDAGVDGELPPRPMVARLRELARRWGEAVAASRTLGQAEADAKARLQPLERRLADAELPTDLDRLREAVAVALRLGDGVDERCAAMDAAAVGSGTAVSLALAKLAPWTGDANDLGRSSGVHADEVTAAEIELLTARDAARAAAGERRRLADELAAIDLDRSALAQGGTAVSEADIVEARRIRDERLVRVRAAIGEPAAAEDARGAVDSHAEAAVAADDLADRRFVLAEGSARLSLAERRSAALALGVEQAEAKREDAMAAETGALERWRERLAGAGLPAFEPARMRAWLADRLTALEAIALAARDAARAEEERARRRAAIDGLLRAMPDVADAGGVLSGILAEGERRRDAGDARMAAYRSDHAEIRQLGEVLADGARQRRVREEERIGIEAEWAEALATTGLGLSIDDGATRLSVLEELRAAVDELDVLHARLRGIETDGLRFAADLEAVWNEVGGVGEPSVDDLRTKLAAARRDAALGDEIASEIRRRADERGVAAAAHATTAQSLVPILADLGGVAVEGLDAAVQASRRVRTAREQLAAAEAEAARGGDGHALAALDDEWRGSDPDAVAARAAELEDLVVAANGEVTAAAEAEREARLAFAALDVTGGDAAAAAADAEQARAEMGVQAEAYLLKRAQALTLRWAVDRYRQDRQDPLLDRASRLFRRLTLGRYAELRIDYDTSRLLGVAADGKRAIDVDAMSDGTADQLFLALRLAAVEQAAAAGVRLPFLADDLFINLDDERARAGFEVLAELARTTQVLFFTHHRHLATIARDLIGADCHSQCSLDDVG